MKTLTIAIDTDILNNIRKQQSCIIRRSYNLACEGLTFKSINQKIPQGDLDGHLYRCGIQRGIDLASTKQRGIIFGGKKEFVRRCKGLITNEQWKLLREQPIYSIGQANVRGNRKFRIDYERRKLIYNSEIEFDIPLLKNNWEVILEEISRKANNRELSLTFSVSRNSVSITFDEQQLECYQKKYTKYKYKANYRYMGIDLNPNRIGIAIYEPSKKVGGTVIFAQQYELTSDKQNIRKNEISHICNTIYKVMKHYGVSRVGMEDLSVKVKDHGKGKKFNKLVNFWIRNFIQNKIHMICDLVGIKFCPVYAQYSSFIGTMRNQELGDCCGAAAELARRCAYKKNDFYPKLITISAIEHRWKEMAGAEYDSWIELYREFKNRHVGWRSPPDVCGSYNLGSHSMRVLVRPFNSV